MKLTKTKISVLLIVFLLSLPILSFAADYKLTGHKIPNAPSGYFEFMSTKNGYLYDRTYNAIYYWNSKGYSYFGRTIVNLSLDRNLSITDSAKKYKISEYWNSSSETLGITFFYTDGGIEAKINTSKLDVDYPAGTTSTDSKSLARNRAYESIIAHELGHVFGLDDLFLYDTKDSIMSRYMNITTLYRPTSKDMAGVKASYKIP